VRQPGEVLLLTCVRGHEGLLAGGGVGGGYRGGQPSDPVAGQQVRQRRRQAVETAANLVVDRCSGRGAQRRFTVREILVIEKDDKLISYRNIHKEYTQRMSITFRVDKPTRQWAGKGRGRAAPATRPAPSYYHCRRSARLFVRGAASFGSPPGCASPRCRRRRQ
jgi:hypothetical protein